MIGGSLALFAWRAPKVGLGGRFDPVSRESMLLVNNVLLVVAAGSVLLGTLYPLFLDALGLGKISVGPPYFDAVFVPLMAPLVFLMGIGPIARWKKAEVPDLVARLKWALGVAIGAGLLVPFAAGRWSPMIAFGLALAFWVVAASLREREGAHPQLPGPPRREARGPAARLLGHDPRAPRRGACSSSASPWSRATRPSATCAWTSATPSRSAATRSASTACAR